MIRRGKLLAALAIGVMPLAMVPTAGQAQIFIGVNVRIGPPPLPVYDQPPIPGPNYVFAPGYWAWDDWWGDYYWVPGTWVQAPRPGLLWTPGWWGWNAGAYSFHGGYWGPHVGWYGGISYGFGYTGTGYYGGEWRGDNFFYNRSVNNIGNSRVTNVFNRTVINNNTIINYHNVSYSGGPGGVAARPTPEQRMAMNEPHFAATPQQIAHNRAAQTDRTAFVSVNRGRPAVLAVAHPRPAPTVPIHPAGMARPAPGGGLPGAGAHGGAHGAPGDTHAAPGGAEPAGMAHTSGHPERPDNAGMRSAPLEGMSTGMHERENAASKAPGMEAPPHAPRPMDRGGDGAMRGGTADYAPPAEHPHAAAPRPMDRGGDDAMRGVMANHAPPLEHPHAAPPQPPHPLAPPHHAAPPPEHRAPPHEGGVVHPGEGDHHHD